MKSFAMPGLAQVQKLFNSLLPRVTLPLRVSTNRAASCRLALSHLPSGSAPSTSPRSTCGSTFLLPQARSRFNSNVEAQLSRDVSDQSVSLGADQLSPKPTTKTERQQ